jgi:hypothetical protein
VDAAAALDDAAAELDEGRRFPLCEFDDYWRPFLGGHGPAPGMPCR